MKSNQKMVVSSYAIVLTSILLVIALACSKDSGSSGKSSSAGNVQAAAAGDGYSLVIKKDGTLWAFGFNEDGQLGLGNKDQKIKPEQVKSLGSDVAAVTAGGSHSLVLKKDGSLWAFGKNDNGQLGIDEIKDSTSLPAKIASFANDVNAVVAGHEYSLVLKKDDTLWAFGLNDFGELGSGDKIASRTPKQITGTNIKEIKAIAAGHNSSFFIKNDGSLWVFGYNADGQLGLGNTNEVLVPTKVDILGLDVKAVSAGEGHTLVLKNDNTLWAFGSNRNGQLGLGNKTDTNKPLQAIDDVNKDVVAIVAGSNYSLALKKDGTLWGFGVNDSGQLGLGSDEGSDKALKVESLGDSVQAIYAGSPHSLVIKKDGTLWGFGSNAAGQLGQDDSIEEVLKPTRINIP